MQTTTRKPESIERGVFSPALAATALASCIVAFDVSALNVAFPVIVSELDVGLSDIQWLAGIYSLAFTGLLLPGGVMSDRLGPKRLLVVSLVLTAFAAGMSISAPSLGWLLVARAVQGCGAALMTSSSTSLLMSAYPESERRAKAIGIWGGLSAMGLVLGPLLGGMVVEWLGWRWLFVAHLACCGLTLVFVAGTPVARTSMQRELDWLGLLCLMMVLACVVYVLIEVPRQRGVTWPSVIAAVSACILGLLFLRADRGAGHSMLSRALFKRAGLVAALAMALLQTMGYYGSLYLLPLVLQTSGSSPLDVGLTMAPMTIATGLTAILCGPLMNRVKHQLIGTCGLLSGALGAVLLTVDTGGRLGLVLSMVLLGCSGGLLPLIVYSAMSRIPLADSGAGAGMVNFARQCGGLFGVATIGLAASFTTDMRFGFIPVAAAFCAAALAARSSLRT